MGRGKIEETTLFIQILLFKKQPQRTKTKETLKETFFRYLSGFAANRFKVFNTGSTIIPTFSRATTPKIGSHSFGPKIIYAIIFSLRISNLTRLNNHYPIFFK